MVRVLARGALEYDPVRLRRYQEGRLRALVHHAAARVPFYRRRFAAAGVRPSDIQTIEDLARLPVLTKSELRSASPRDRLAEGIREDACVLMETSGSTGEPTRMYKDRAALFAIAAWSSPLNISRWVGAPAWRVMTLLVRDEHSLEAGLVRYLPRALLRVHEGDALADPGAQLAALQVFRPHLLITYPSVLRNLAVAARRAGTAVHQPRAIALSAEVFDRGARALAREVFPRAGLHNGYGSTEAGLIALECAEHRGLHVAGTQVIVELRRDGRPVPPGLPGEVVVTDLTNFASPLIRYAGLGDVATWSPSRCTCGRILPLLDVVEGRQVDSFHLPDGRVVHPYTLTLALEHIAGIDRFQIVQEAPGRVHVLLVGPTGDGVAGREMTASALRAILGPGVEIGVESVPAIPHAPGTAAGRTVRSLVSG